MQTDALRDAGGIEGRIYKDLASGRKDNRPGLNACLKALEPGNTLVVWKLDRLGRDLKHLINLIEEFKDKNIGLKVLAGTGVQIDTTTFNGRMIFGLFTVLAEFERELIIERTRAGFAATRASGRPRKMDKATLIMAMTAVSESISVAANVTKLLCMITTTLSMVMV